LSQKDDDDDRPIAYASYQLKDAETRYGATQIELYAVVFAVRHFRTYLLGREFHLFSDHSALRSLLTNKMPSPWLARWVMELSEYSFTFSHVPGRMNGPADALSRAEYGFLREDLPLISSLTVDWIPVWDRARILAAQQQDPILGPINSSSKAQDADQEISDYFLDDDHHLCYHPEPNKDRALLCAPKVLVPHILKKLHDDPTAGHRGLYKTIELVRRQFYWPGLYTDVKNYVQKYLKFKQFKARPPTSLPFQKFDDATRPMQRVSLDIVGPSRAP
jgi:hypothetical protein